MNYLTPWHSLWLYGKTSQQKEITMETEDQATMRLATTTPEAAQIYLDTLGYEEDTDVDDESVIPVEAWTAPAYAGDIDLSGPNGLMAIFGAKGDWEMGIRTVRVFNVEDRVAVYAGDELEFDAPFDQAPRVLHRAARLYNAEVRAAVG